MKEGAFNGDSQTSADANIGRIITKI